MSLPDMSTNLDLIAARELRTAIRGRVVFRCDTDFVQAR
jgi:hypothetical protein